MTGPPAGRGGTSEGGFSWPSYSPMGSEDAVVASPCCVGQTPGEPCQPGMGTVQTSCAHGVDPCLKGTSISDQAEAVSLPIPSASVSSIFTRQPLPLTPTPNPSHFTCHSETWKTAKFFFFFSFYKMVVIKKVFQVGILYAKFQCEVSFYGWVINPLKYVFIMEMLTQPLYTPDHNSRWCKIPYIESRDKWIFAIKSK